LPCCCHTEHFTERELDAFRLVAAGAANHEVATALNIRQPAEVWSWWNSSRSDGDIAAGVMAAPSGSKFVGRAAETLLKRREPSALRGQSRAPDHGDDLRKRSSGRV
jgi:hypothetical protein